MLARVRESNLASSRVLGGVLVFAGVVMFLAVFLTAYPVLSDPVGTYDGWFPPNNDEPTVTEPVDEEPEFEAPRAEFRFVAESRAVASDPPAEGEEVAEGEEPTFVYVVSFEDRSEAPDGEIVNRVWDLGDGAEADRPSFVHQYEGPGFYPVRLEIEDEHGQTSVAEGEIEVPEEGRSGGRIESGDAIDLSGLEEAVEDAVSTLTVSVDDALDSAGSAARSTAIVVLFALAAIATTVVAWRVTRAGIMLLSPDHRLRLKVRSADMHVDMGKSPLDDAVNEVITEQPELVDA